MADRAIDKGAKIPQWSNLLQLASKMGWSERELLEDNSYLYIERLLMLETAQAEADKIRSQEMKKGQKRRKIR